MRQLECCGGPTVVVRPMSKTGAGNFFEDFRIGQVIRHATPRTITVGDVALYNGLFGPRFAVQSSDAFARAIGYPFSPIDDLLVFHVVFGKTVPDISLNAVANLGYAAGRVLDRLQAGRHQGARIHTLGHGAQARRGSAGPRRSCAAPA